MFEEIKQQAEQAALELVMGAKLQPGQLVVIGCSSSEMVGSASAKAAASKRPRLLMKAWRRYFRTRAFTWPRNAVSI